MPRCPHERSRSSSPTPSPTPPSCPTARRGTARSPTSRASCSSSAPAASISWHVPYKGIGQAVSDLIGGQIPMLSANATAQVLDLHRAGKVRILAVNARASVKSAPDIPTAIEAGLPDMVAQTTFGVFAPAGTPWPILESINAVTQEAMADPQFQNELLRLGFEPVLDVGPDKAAGVFREELARWTPILKTTSTKPE